MGEERAYGTPEELIAEARKMTTWTPIHSLRWLVRQLADALDDVLAEMDEDRA